MSSTSSPSGSWTFVTNHAAVLICLASDSEIRMRDIAARVGITERAAQRIEMGKARMVIRGPRGLLVRERLAAIPYCERPETSAGGSQGDGSHIAVHAQSQAAQK